jgi:hypothetical protein
MHRFRQRVGVRPARREVSRDRPLDECRAGKEQLPTILMPGRTSRFIPLKIPHSCRGIPPPQSKRRANSHELPAVSAPVTRSQGIDSRCSSSRRRRWTDPSAVGRTRAPASIPMSPGRATWFASASAASRIGSRTDPSHGTPRRHVGVDEATRLASPVRDGIATRIVEHRALESRRSPRNSRSD